MTTEELWRATLHDFNNLMAGIQGVLDLSDPRLPLDQRNRARLESTLADGKTLVAMARTLALGRLPGNGPMPWAEWQAGLMERLDPLSALYHCPIELVDAGASGEAWTGPLLQDWVAAFTRQILPWTVPGPLRLEASATPGTWVLTWVGDAPMPVALEPEPPPDAPRNLPSYWLQAMVGPLGVTVEATPLGLVARVDRSAGASVGAGPVASSGTEPLNLS